MAKYGGSPKCVRCGKSVYYAEKAIIPNYHKACFTCKTCNKRLDSSTLLKHGGEIYCPQHHALLGGATGFRGGGTSGGGLMARTHAGHTNTNTKFGNSSGGNSGGNSAGGGGGFCSGCGAKATGGKFCSGCGNAL
eukprot:TRINITY_DN12016_c0_g1_i1.p1 TRINITY_DN12016_c0_g1~~TRINITY_DN12016_c0_g1_i1.p1  ORF type:complete len:147 (+),score=18.00 TRINITY_DN12016_c0_g1_i1:38-442(+)